MVGQRHRGRGFTLLEVLVAAAVLAVALAASVRAVGQIVGATAELRERTVASWIAVNRIERARAGLVPLEPGVHRGRVTMADAAWAWELELVPERAPPAGFVGRLDLPPLLHAEARVRKADTERNLVTRSTYLPAVPPEDPGRGR